MPIEIDGTPISNATITLTRGGVWIQQWAFLDEAGVADPTLDAKFIIEPRGGQPSEEWNSANGRFTNVATGTYLLDLQEAYTTAILWDFANYHLYVVESSGNVDPCIVDGYVFVNDC